MVKKKVEKTTQETKPKKGDPVEIPIPSKGQIENDFAKIVSGEPEDDSDQE